MNILLIFWHIFCICLIQGNANHHSSIDHGQTDKVESADNDEYVVVHTIPGNIRGKIIPAVGKQGKVLEFLGIPYADKPVGDLRFSDPSPKASWEGTLDTLHHGNVCNQPIYTKFGDFEGTKIWTPTEPLNEDCLFLNIWTPYPRPNNASIMVWFHGGGFSFGASSLWVYNGNILSGYTDVIVVSVNYRLGAFGFLASGDDRIKGNFGLKDQVLALQWVKDNIAQFGGNPASVTIFGESAGASSVGYHLASPLSKNLFHKAIMESGTHGCHFAFHTKDEAKVYFEKILSFVDCPNDENARSCLCKVPEKKLTKYMDEAWKTLQRISFPFVPIIDDHFIKEDPNYSIDKSSFKNVPTLLTVNGNEASSFLIYYFQDHFHKDNDSCISRNVFSEIIDKFYKDLSPNTLEFIKFYYTDWTDSNNPIKIRDLLCEVIGDREFNCPMHHFAEKTRVYNQDVYLAEFNYRASNDPWPVWMGAYHGSELQFVFGHPLNESRGYSDKDRIVSKRIMTYWSNFAKFGNPNGDPDKDAPVSDINIKWPSLHLKHQHLEITDELKINQHLKDGECQLWNELLPALSHLSCSTN